MSFTAQEIWDKATELATGVAGDANVSPLVDSEVTAEVAYPHALKAVFRDYALLGKFQDDVNMDHAVEVLNGEATLPSTIMREFLDRAYIVTDKFASKVSYEDYLRFRFDNQMCYFSVRNGKIYYSCLPGLISQFADTATIDAYARGVWTFKDNPVEGETIVVNGTTFTFRGPGIVVAGAGTGAANGTYTERGTSAGYPFYNLVGQPDDPDAYATARNIAGSWAILDSNSYTLYGSNTTTATSPWLTTYSAAVGSPPAPTVAQRTFSSVEVEIGATRAATAANFAAVLNASTDANVSVATYVVGTSAGGSTSEREYPAVIGTYDTSGTVGNTFTMAASSASSVVVSASTFTGGEGTVVLTTDLDIVNTPGRRMRIVTTNGTVIIDAFVDYLIDENTIRFRGSPLPLAENVPQAVTVYIYDPTQYVTNRSLTSVNTTAGSRTVTCAGASFTSADVGRRLPVLVSSVYRIDAIIASINSGTSVEMQAKALASTSTGTADVGYIPLTINCPGTPALPANATDNVSYSDSIAQDVIVKLAAILRGEIPLQNLIDARYGGSKKK